MTTDKSDHKYRLRPLLPLLEQQRRDLKSGRELWMTDALSMLARKEWVLAPHIEGRWLTTGDPLNLLHASLAFSRAAIQRPPPSGL